MVGDDPMDGFPFAGIWIPYAERMGENEEYTDTDEGRNEFPDNSSVHFLDMEHDIWQHVFDSLHHADDLFRGCMRDAKSWPQYEAKVMDMKELEKLYQQASVPVWRADDSVSSVSLISTIVVIMTMCTTHSVSNAFVDELLKYLSMTLLSKKNVCQCYTTMLRMMCGRWDYSTILFIVALLAMCSSMGIWRTSRCAHIQGVACLGGFLDQQLSQQKY
jgi:hypothetical protein